MTSIGRVILAPATIEIAKQDTTFFCRKIKSNTRGRPRAAEKGQPTIALIATVTTASLYFLSIQAPSITYAQYIAKELGRNAVLEMKEPADAQENNIVKMTITGSVRRFFIEE